MEEDGGADAVAAAKYFAHADRALFETREKLDRTYEEFQQVIRLRVNIETLRDAEISTFQSKVNIGCDVYVDTQVPNCRSIFIELGCGLYMEKSLVDALEFLKHKENFLQCKINTYLDAVADIRTRAKLMDEVLSSTVF